MWRKFLLRHRLAEALYCQTCFERNLDHGCHARVVQSGLTIEAGIACRHASRYGKGTGLH